MDKISKKMRSQIMAKVKGRETNLEKAFRSLLWKKGVRYRKNNAKYFGKPDLLIRKMKIVIFIDSCFWHGCIEHLRLPSSNKDYWITKIKRNRIRDKEVNHYYEDTHWTIIRIWEHEFDHFPEVASNIKRIIDSSRRM